MRTPAAPFPFRAMMIRILLLSLCGFLLQTSLQGRQKVEWLPVTPEEQAATASPLEPNAPAEILFRRIEMNDRDLPVEREIKDYVRFKIYQPDKAQGVTRISRQEENIAGGIARTEVEIRARLILPNGKITEFGKESIKERTLSQSAAERSLMHTLFGSPQTVRKEKFMAISGIEPGSIVEYCIETTYERPNDPFFGYTLQMRDIPIRKIDFKNEEIRSQDFTYGCFLLNKRIGGAELVEDKKEGIVRITASNLPSLPHEPFSGSPAEYGLVVLHTYKTTTRMLISRSGVQQHYSMEPSKVGYWAPIATDAYVQQEDCAVATGRIEKIAKELTAKAGTQAEKAKLIHQYAHERYEEFRKLPSRNKNTSMSYYMSNRALSLDEVLDYAKDPDRVGVYRSDFLWLAMVMYRAVGLECRQVLLANKNLVPFNRMIVTQALLNDHAAQVKIDNNWVFSCPNQNIALPLGAIPWQAEGQEALIAQPEKEEFVPTPSASAKQSMIGSGGVFELSADGTLMGTCKRKFIGHSADVIRTELLRQKEPKAVRAYFRRMLEDIFRQVGETESTLDETPDKDDESGAVAETRTLKVDKIVGLEGAGELELSFSVTLPGYAIVAGDRLILRPSVFRHNFTTPFPSPTRINAVRFPYAWQELDTALIKIPAGFRPDIGEQPPQTPFPGMFYRNQITFDAEKNAIRFRREFMCQRTFVPADVYGPFKTWYDEMVRGDQYDLVLVKGADSVAQPTQAK